jgi:leucyl aminopeptidase
MSSGFGSGAMRACLRWEARYDPVLVFLGQGDELPQLLPDTALPRTRALSRSVRAEDLAQLDAWFVVIADDLDEAAWRTLPRGNWLRGECARRKLRAGAVLSARLDNDAQTLLIAGLRKRRASVFETLQLGGRLLKEAKSACARRVGASVLGLSAAAAQESLEAVTAATYAAAFELPSYKSRDERCAALEELTLFGVRAPAALKVTAATSEGNNLARWLTALPGNELTPATYRRRVAQLARREGWRMRFLDSRALQRAGAGAFLAVSRGSEDDTAGIIHLRYQPRGKSKRALALVGKGICFDTGGTNLKAHRGMLDMHTDMEGSAVALGTLLALTRLRAPHAIDCWLAVTENRIGPRAYKPQDVVTASNGVSIQVIHTDAEGRMVLADALALAAREKPALIVDFATLTSACVNALTERYAGVFTNRPVWHTLLERAGAASGERVWPFPMDEDFDTDLESANADVMQCTLDNKGDHILAARFLNRFVSADVPWVHVDLASGQRASGLGHITTDITGFGVRYAVYLVTSQKILERATKRARP